LLRRNAENECIALPPCLVRLVADVGPYAEAVFQSCLDRIAEARKPVVRAWSDLAGRGRVAKARAFARDGKKSLHGVPFALSKDIFDTAIWPTGYGSPIYTGWLASQKMPALRL